MKPYLLLTPGPLTTSETVKEAMMTDWCTWDEDYNLGIVQELRKDLVNIATKKPEEYTSILLQGSGTYCVEAVLGATITPEVMWDLVTRDYSKRLNGRQVLRKVKHYVRNGSIITFHDSLKAEKNMKYALPRAIEWLLEQGYEFKVFD